MKSWLLLALCPLILGGCGRLLVRHEPSAAPRAWNRPADSSSASASSSSAGREGVLQYARAQIGKPYCWGGAGPGCFDCSGLVESAWRQAGVTLPRTSEAMSRQLHEVPLIEARAGDVLYWPGHVGLYAGDGLVIDAGATKHQIAERRMWGVPRVLRPLESDS